MQQFESVMFKGRPFPEEDPVMGVPFLLELTTFVLSGTHDIDRMDGPLTIFTPSEKLPFLGMRAASTHTYPKDICGRDGSGIIFSMIAGADDRTCIHPDSRHVFHPVFGTPAAGVLREGSGAECGRRKHNSVTNLHCSPTR